MVPPSQKLARSFAILQASREPSSPKANPSRSTPLLTDVKLVEEAVAAWKQGEKKGEQTGLKRYRQTCSIFLLSE